MLFTAIQEKFASPTHSVTTKIIILLHCRLKTSISIRQAQEEVPTQTDK